MSGLIVVLYTSVGGVIGAGLTQYVTHVRDRRAARALVIERLSDVEEIYATLRWPIVAETPYSSSRVAKELGLLEAAALIAGIPKSVITCYIISCRYIDNTQRVSHGAKLLGNQIAAEVSGNIDEVKAMPNRAKISASLTVISDNIKLILETIKKQDQAGLRLHDASLLLLGKVLWHPIRFQFNIRSLRRVRRSASTLTEQIQQLSNLLLQMHSLFEQTAPGQFIVRGKNAESNQAALPPAVDPESAAVVPQPSEA
jgi:hypothetical protein